MRIIMFHGVCHEAAAEFTSQIEYLTRRFSIISLDALLQKLASGDDSSSEIVLTFDDGLRNNCTVVYPILKRLGVKATFYVCPGLIETGQWLWNHEMCVRLSALGAARRAELCQTLKAQGTAVSEIIEWMKTLSLPLRRVAGLPGFRLPFPRHPRDPRAISDPRLILDEFPDLVGDRQIGPGPD